MDTAPHSASRPRIEPQLDEAPFASTNVAPGNDRSDESATKEVMSPVKVTEGQSLLSPSSNSGRRPLSPLEREGRGHPHSDDDIDHEGRVREKFKETSIGALSGHHLESQSKSGDTRPQRDEGSLSTDQHLGDADSVAKAEDDLDTRSADQERDDKLPAGKEAGASKGRPPVPPSYITPVRSTSDADRPGRDGAGTANETNHHSAKEGGATRRRPATPPDSTIPAEKTTEELAAQVASPRRKRSRDQFDNDLEKDVRPMSLEGDETGRSSEDADRATGDAHSPKPSRTEPEKKRHRDTSQESAVQTVDSASRVIPSTSGLANTSSVSPFGTLGTGQPIITAGSSAGKGREASVGAQRPTPGFATSTFGALAGSSASPFGALGGSLISGSSPAAAGSSGFARLGSSSDPKSGFGGGLTSFAPQDGTSIFASKQATKPFGAPEIDGDASGEGDEDGVGTSLRGSKDDIETGEEGEETRFSARAKLFYFDSTTKTWKERGFGLLKLNVTKSNGDDEVDRSDEESNPQTAETMASQEKQSSKPNKLARLLMRSEAVYRVILNVPVFKTLKAGDQNGDIPPDRSVKFTALEDKKPVMMQLRLGNKASASELWRRMKEVQKEL